MLTIPRLRPFSRAQIIDGELDINPFHNARLGFCFHEPVGTTVILLVCVVLMFLDIFLFLFGL